MTINKIDPDADPDVLGQESLGRIVVGVDGSAESNRALQWAGILARQTGALIDAVTVCEIPFSYGTAEGWTDPAFSLSPHDDAQKALTAAVDESFGSDRPAGLRTYVLEGNGARRLLEHAAGASMLVVGSRGRGGFMGLLLGSVSAKCAAHAPCPVLVVHAHDPMPEG